MTVIIAIKATKTSLACPLICRQATPDYASHTGVAGFSDDPLLLVARHRDNPA
jgi:hypothetical protein